MTENETAIVTRVQASFARQRVMDVFGAKLLRVEPGVTEIVLPYREDLTQQHGFLHAGVVTAIADTACGYAALTVIPEGSGVLSVEFKVNLLNPARGKRFLARGTVVKPGRTIVVCTGEVIAERADGSTQTVAIMQATMMAIRDRPGIND